MTPAGVTERLGLACGGVGESRGITTPREVAERIIATSSGASMRPAPLSPRPMASASPRRDHEKPAPALRNRAHLAALFEVDLEPRQ